MADRTGARVSAIQAAWNASSRGNLDSLETIYANDINFEDPIATGRGVEDLKKHFGRLFRGLSKASYTYRGWTGSPETLVMEWTLKAELRSSGKAFELPGISWLQLDPESGKITRSREYFDLGRGLYEHVPVLGYFIRKIRQRLQSHGRFQERACGPTRGGAFLVKLGILARSQKVWTAALRSSF